MIYVLVIVCAMLLGFLVHRYDMYDREPWHMSLLAVLLGAAAIVPVGHIEDQSHALLGLQYEDLAAMALVAATHEELAKLLMVVLIAVVARRHFNDPMDGLIYGALVGLGMALGESLFYLGLLQPESVVFAGSEAVRLLLHLLMGGLSGFAVGLAFNRLSYWPLALVVWLGASMGLHYLWDYWLGLPLANMVPPPVEPRIASITLMCSALVMFGGTVILASRLSRQFLEARSPQSLWGWPFRSRREQ